MHYTTSPWNWVVGWFVVTSQERVYANISAKVVKPKTLPKYRHGFGILSNEA
jgi:hypothetical protein